MRPYHSMRSRAGLLVCVCDGECPAGWTEKRRKGCTIAEASSHRASTSLCLPEEGPIRTSITAA